MRHGWSTHPHRGGGSDDSTDESRLELALEALHDLVTHQYMSPGLKTSRADLIEAVLVQQHTEVLRLRAELGGRRIPQPERSA